MSHSFTEARLKPLLYFFLVLGLTLAGYAPFLIPVAASAANSINVWWPSEGAHMSGTQPFKAMIEGLDVANYDMYWRVDGGQWNAMSNSYTDYQHKEASVDLTGWTWHGTGPYTVDFSARQGGNEIATYTTHIYVDNGLSGGGSSPSAVQTATVQAPVVSATTSASTATLAISLGTSTSATASTTPATLAPLSAFTSTLPINSSGFYVDLNSDAAKQASAWASSDPTDAALMQRLASNPTAVWFGDWNGNVQSDVNTLVSAAHQAGQTPVLVAYDIPQRDCGGYSSGGTGNPDGYRAWIDAFAKGIGQNSAVVILEPDALAQISCLSSADQNTRLSLLSYAVSKIQAQPRARVYLDAGHEGWVDPATMADLLARANVASASGFALNVSNFEPTVGEESYGAAISSRVGGKHFVIDTARNGVSVSGWCNPTGAAIGQAPSTNTGNSLVDAFVWAKVPGESDGNCNGGPSAGQWWPSYAVSLVKNAL